MKSKIMCILSFMLFFSAVDLSVINLFRSCSFQIEKGTISTALTDALKVQNQVFKQTKAIVSKVCVDIINDIEFLFAPVHQNKLFISGKEMFIKPYSDTYFNSTKAAVLCIFGDISYAFNSSAVILFFFGFIFVYMISYVGLLRAFWDRNAILNIRKAYGDIKSRMLFLLFTEDK